MFRTVFPLNECGRAVLPTYVLGSGLQTAADEGLVGTKD